MSIDNKSISTIIWDWNGTLLDDVDACLTAINVLLERRQRPRLSRQKYRQVFGFPVKDYYRSLGFNIQEEWETIAAEFMDAYRAALNGKVLFDDVIATLSAFQVHGYVQCILSALEHSLLERHVNHFGIAPFFAHIQGIDDHYAKTKLDKGTELIARLAIEPRQILCIGDTTHDIEVAHALGCQCAIVARGHQSRERLSHNGVPVLDHLAELTRLLSG